MYREIKVENGLKSSDCNYKTFGTLDYQIADELINMGTQLTQNPESALTKVFCKIAKIASDKDFVLNKGCLAKNESKSISGSSLCISTSSTYNNWECLRYDRTKNAFVIYYGQAFAD